MVILVLLHTQITPSILAHTHCNALISETQNSILATFMNYFILMNGAGVGVTMMMNIHKYENYRGSWKATQQLLEFEKVGVTFVG